MPGSSQGMAGSSNGMDGSPQVVDVASSPVSARAPVVEARLRRKSDRKKNDPLPPLAVEMMKAWFEMHKDDPYPDEQTKLDFAQKGAALALLSLLLCLLECMIIFGF